MSIDKVRGRALKRTFPGPSKTITVEPSKVPRAPPLPMVPLCARVPEPDETDLPREPSGVG